MKKWNQHIKVTAFLTVWIIGGMVDAQDKSKSIELTSLWKTFSPTEINEVRGITQTKEGKYLAFGNTYSKAEGESHWWGELDLQGKKVKEVKNWDPRGFRNSNVVSLLQTKDRSIWVIGERTISKFNPEGKMLFSKSVYKISPIERYGLSVHAAVKSNDNGLILAGSAQKERNNHDAWMMKIDSTGKNLWEKNVDYKKDEMIFHGIRNKDRILFTAATGKIDKFGAGMDGVLVLAYNDKGEQLGKYNTKGTIFPSCIPTTILEDGSAALAISRGKFPMRDAWLIRLDSKLNQSWEKQIAKQEVTAFTPSVSSDSTKNLIVTWNGMKGLHFWKFQLNGKELSKEIHSSARGFFVPQTSGKGRLFLQKTKSF